MAGSALCYRLDRSTLPLLGVELCASESADMAALILMQPREVEKRFALVWQTAPALFHRLFLAILIICLRDSHRSTARIRIGRPFAELEEVILDEVLRAGNFPRYFAYI